MQNMHACLHANIITYFRVLINAYFLTWYLHLLVLQPLELPWCAVLVI